MPDVYNWHLGRPMPTTRGTIRSGNLLLSNINRCIGCQTCTGSCKATWTLPCQSICGGTMWSSIWELSAALDVKTLKLLDERTRLRASRRVGTSLGRRPRRAYGVYNGLALTGDPMSGSGLSARRERMACA